MSPDWTSIDFSVPKTHGLDQKVVLEYCPERIFSHYFGDFHISLHTASRIFEEILTVQNFDISVAREKIDQSISKTQRRDQKPFTECCPKRILGRCWSVFHISVHTASRATSHKFDHQHPFQHQLSSIWHSATQPTLRAIRPHRSDQRFW